jgi:hypothetical protein
MHGSLRQNGLIKFMIDDRNEEVHDSGSSRSVGQEGVEFGIGIHHTPGHPITAYRPSYSFTIDGVDRKVTEACGACLALLQQMVAEFQADVP